MNKIILSLFIVCIFGHNYRHDEGKYRIHLPSFFQNTPIKKTVKFIGFDNYPITKWSLIVYSGNTLKTYKSSETNFIEISSNDYNANKKVKIFFENMGLIEKLYKIPDSLLSKTLTMKSFLEYPVYRFERPY